MEVKSFKLNSESVYKLRSIVDELKLESNSDAVRFCIDHVYDMFVASEYPVPSKSNGNNEDFVDGLSALIRDNRVLLMFVLMELVKLHGGDIKPYDDCQKEYLIKLKSELRTAVQKERNGR